MIEKRALDFFKSLRLERPLSELDNSSPYMCSYKYCDQFDKLMLYPSVFSALTRGLCRDLNDPLEKMYWSLMINDYQDPEYGWFKNFKRPHSEIDTERKWRHLTEHTLIALSYLGAKPKYELSFLKKYHNPDYMIKWLDSLDWSNPWKMSNWVLEIGMMLQYERDFMAGSIGSGLDAWFDWHDKRQCPVTGFWGDETFPKVGYKTQFGGTFNALYGAYHQYLVYYYEGRQINYSERIIDTVLGLQHQNGSFKEDGGNGACEDIDAADVLVNFSLLTNYRNSDIKEALEKMTPKVIEHQQVDGGFTYENEKDHIFVWLEVKEHGLDTKVLPDGRIVRPHRHTTVKSGTSTAFATWFRLLNLASMSRVIQIKDLNDNWNFSRCPGFHFDIRKKNL